MVERLNKMAMRPSTHREGFICPVCRFQYDSDEQLVTHFEVAHSLKSQSGSPTDQSSIGAAFKKVQKKLFNKNEIADGNPEFSSPEDEIDGSIQEATGIQGVLQQQTHVGEQYSSTLAMNRFDGRSRKLYSDFLALRRERIDRRVIETNKLLFRLEKLLLIDPSVDLNKRTQLEQEIVPWVVNKDMPLCSLCGSSFSKLKLSRRRHHCRLCGTLMCASCSVFLNRSAAIQLVQRTQQQSYSSNSELFFTDSNDRKSPTSIALSSMTRSVSMPAVAATRFIQGDENKAGTAIRVCTYCTPCLERSRAAAEPEVSPIAAVYERLNSERTYISEHMPEYNEMVARLREGDGLHTIKAADELRLTLMGAIRKLDTLSKKMLEKPEEFGNSPAMIRLASNIRRASVDFAQKWGGMLSDLPTPEEVERIREDREKMLAERVEREREQLAKRSMARQVMVRQAPERVEGWAVTATANGAASDVVDDPFVQQLELIRSYLNQAEADGRTEEATALRQNYEELKREVRRREIRQILEGED